MSIKLLAIELYRAQQDTARLETQLAAAPLNMPLDTMAALREKLRQAQAELQLLRKMLDDKKGSAAEDLYPVRLRCR
jgi:hypothetical protein